MFLVEKIKKELYQVKKYLIFLFNRTKVTLLDRYFS